MAHTWRDCYAVLDGTVLKVGNDAFERAWDLGDGAPRALSVLDRARGREWVRPAPYPDAIRRADLPLRGAPRVALETAPDDAGGLAEEHLLVSVALTYEGAGLTWRHQVWPGFPVVLSQLVVRRTGAAPPLDPEPFFDSGDLHLHPADDRLDFFGLAPLHLGWESAAFYARSDHRDTLVRERRGATYPKEAIREPGHWLHLADRVQAGGLLAVKLAPPPDEQLQYPGHDFVLSGRTLAITGMGLPANELAGGEAWPTYLSGVGVTDGTRDQAIDLFHALDGRRIRPNPARHFAVLSNTWGDGNGTKRINDAMMVEEIRAGAALGLTHCQMDAGWQQGNIAGLNVEELRPKGTYGIDPDFWAVHRERFPHGLAPLAALAREAGVALGFWFVPDAANEYAHWRRDADVVLGLWRAHGLRAVKIDGVSIHTKVGETRFMAFLRALHADSGGALSVQFDITGGRARRLGHFYGAEFTASLFVENRYARDGSYFPHRTLRALWLLSRFIPSRRLQMEFVNPQTLREIYGDDPLAPAAFGAAYACAAVLFANPLCWMETGRLAPADRRVLSRLIRAYLPHQQAILMGRVYPVGEEPTGRSWTGFQSVTGDRQGYLIVFREWTDRVAGRFVLRGVAPGARLACSTIAGAGRVRALRVGPDGAVTVRLATPRSFAMLRYGLD